MCDLSVLSLLPRLTSADILKLNLWIQEYATEANAGCGEYYAATVGGKGILKEGFFQPRMPRALIGQNQ